MASSLYKERSQFSPHSKWYGFKTINFEDEKQLIERLTRPTQSIIQAQLCNLSISNGNRKTMYKPHSSTIPLHSVYDPSDTVNTGRSNNINNYSQIITNNESNQTNSADKTQSVSATSSVRNVDLRPIVDYEKTAEKLNKLAETWHKNDKLAYILPVCACPKGEQILKQSMENWYQKIESYRSSSPTSSQHSYQTYKSTDYKNQNKIKIIVNRLHNAKTFSSIARSRDARELLISLAKKNSYPKKQSKLTNNIRTKHDLFEPENMLSLFDQKGLFQPIKFISKWEKVQKTARVITRLSKPTITSKLKRQGICSLCEESLCKPTPLGIKIPDSIESKLHHDKIIDQTNLVERLLKPTMCTCNIPIKCSKLTNSQFKLTGELIIEHMEKVGKQLPLISGLERSENINTIIQRLYTGKCRRTECSTNNKPDKNSAK